MSDTKRGRPYIWVTWLTKLLAGEDKCWYRAWYKTNYKYDKTPDDPERAEFFREWTAKHDALVNRRAEELKKLGFIVKLEDEGAFKLVGQKADLSGKPDIVAIAPKDFAIVSDGKAGKKRASDHWQVLIYLFALPLSWMKGTGTRLEGEVEYQDRREPVRPLGDAERAKIVEAINKLTTEKPQPATPSLNECKYCDVANCPFRMETPVVFEGDATRFF